MYKVGLFVICTFILVPGGLGQSCTAENVNACFEDFSEYVEELPNFDRQVKWYNEQQVEDICGLFDEAEECYSPFKWRCSASDISLIEGLEDAYDHLCSTGRSVLADSSECFLDDGLEATLSECSIESDQELARILALVEFARTQSELDRIIVQYCGAVNELFMCVTEAFYMLDVCDERTINYQITINKKLLEPTLDSLNCQIREQCAPARVRRCSDPLSSSYYMYQAQGEFPARTTEEITTICQEYNDYKDCLSPFQFQCSAQSLESFQGLTSASSYICEQGGKEVYLDHMSCLNDTVVTEASVCYKQGLDKIDRIEEQLRTIPSYDVEQRLKSEFCTAINDDILDCVSHALQTVCDDDLVRYQYDVDTKFWQPTLTRLDCTTSEEPTPTSQQPTTGGLGQSCTAENVNGCFEDFSNYVDEVSNIDRQVKWYNEEQVEDICGLFGEAEECYSAFKLQCSESDKLVFEGLEDAYDYLCSTGRSVMADSSECFLDDGLEATLSECQIESEQETDRLVALAEGARSQPELDRIVVQYCGAVNELFMCMTEAFYMLDVCDERAINYQVIFNKKLLEPILEGLNCQIREQCAPARVKRCSDPLSSSYMYYQAQGEFPARTTEEITTICQEYSDYKDCLSPFQSQCSAQSLESFQGLTSASSYICEQGGKEVYIDHMFCLSDTVVTEASVCYKQGLDTIDSIEEQLRTIPPYAVEQRLKDEYCTAINDDILNCVSHALQTVCDDDLVRYQYEVDTAFWQPTMARLDCTIPTSQQPTTTTTPTTQQPTTTTTPTTQQPTTTTTPTTQEPTTTTTPTATKKSGIASFLLPFTALYVCSLVLPVYHLMK